MEKKEREKKGVGINWWKEKTIKIRKEKKKKRNGEGKSEWEEGRRGWKKHSWERKNQVKKWINREMQ